MIENKPLSIPRNGLVGEWLLDGNAIDTNDGTKNNGTATNVTYANTSVGYQKQAGIFSGGSSSSMIVNSGFPAITNNFTISVWIKNTNISQSGTYVYEKGHSGAGNQHAILFGYVANSYEFFSNVFRGGTISISDTNYHLIQYSYDGVTFRAFLDGKQVSATSASFSLNYVNGAFVYGQTNGYGAGTAHWGQSIRFYNRALSTQEIQSLYLEGKRVLGNYGNPDLFKDCVAYYDFKGDARDVVGGYDGTVNGATLTTDRFGVANSAYSFVNSGDGIYLGNGTLINSGSVSVSAWVKPDANGGVIAVRGGFSVDWGFNFGVNNTDGFNFSTHTAPTDNSILSGIIPTPGRYYHVVGVFNQAGSMQLYVDGNLVGSRSCGTSTRSNGTIGWTIGNGNSPNGFPIGTVDELQICYSALTSDEVKALYQASITQKPYPFSKSLPTGLRSGLVLDIQGSQYDQSGNGNDGTLVNSPTQVRRLQSKGVSFNGTNQGVDFGNNAFVTASKYSMEWTLVPTALPASGGFHFIASKIGNLFQTGFYLALYNNSGAMEISLVHVDLAGADDLRWAYPFVAGKAYVCGLSWNGTTATLYVNGTKVGDRSTSKSPVAVTNNFWIGIYGNAMTLPLNGNVHNFRVSTETKTGEQFQNAFYSTYLQ